MQVKCGGCGSLLDASGFAPGTEIRCGRCGGLIRVPGGTERPGRKRSPARTPPSRAARRSGRAAPRRTGGPPAALLLAVGGVVVAIGVLAAVLLTGDGDPAEPAKAAAAGATAPAVESHPATVNGEPAFLGKPASHWAAEIRDDRMTDAGPAWMESMSALGEGREAVLPVLGEILQRHPGSRNSALTALGRVSRVIGARAIRALEPALTSLLDGYPPTPAMFTAAAMLIELDPDHKRALVTLVDGVEKGLWTDDALPIILKLGRRAGPAVPALLKRLDRGNYLEGLGGGTEQRKRLALVLANLARDLPEVIPGLADLLKSGDGVVRFHALLALKEIGPPAYDVLPAVMGCLNDDDEQVTKMARKAVQAIDR